MEVHQCSEVNLSVVSSFFDDDVLLGVLLVTSSMLVVFATKNTLAIGTLLCASLFLFEKVALRTMLGVSSRLLLTLRLSVSVSWRWGCVFV